MQKGQVAFSERHLRDITLTTPNTITYGTASTLIPIVA
jgi:hypothetical protein